MKKDNMHLRAPGNWINDPNGFIYYKGNYHLFYQHFPYGPRWGTMHWGHAVSPDLVHWEHQGIALFPTVEGDQNGCFSGSAIAHEGRLYLYYTGVHYDIMNPDDIHVCLNDAFTSTQMLITSEDGYHFDNFHDKRVVVPPITDPGIGHRTHARDPKVWKGQDAWYMVFGSSTQKRRGELVFYKSKNLTDWTFVNTASAQEIPGWMWECPDYFQTAGGEVLIFSVMGIPVERTEEKNHTICMISAFEEKTCSMMLSGDYQYLDYGFDLYAPQTTADAEGRRVLVAWLRMPRPVDGTWIGMFCIPRVVEVENGHIYFRVHPVIEAQYTVPIRLLSQANEGSCRISFTLEDGACVSIGGYQILREGNQIRTDRSRVFPECENRQLFQMQSITPKLRDGFRLDVYVDPNMIEVYVNRGEYVISHGVWGLSEEIEADDSIRLQMYTLKR